MTTMTKLKIHKIKVDVFDAPFLLIIGPADLLDSWLTKKAINCEMDPNDQGMHIASSENFKGMECRRLIWLSKFKGGHDDLGTLYHEVLHYTLAALRDKGFKPTHDSEEAYTYLAEHAFKECLKALRFHK